MSIKHIATNKINKLLSDKSWSTINYIESIINNQVQLNNYQ